MENISNKTFIKQRETWRKACLFKGSPDPTTLEELRRSEVVHHVAQRFSVPSEEEAAELSHLVKQNRSKEAINHTLLLHNKWKSFTIEHLLIGWIKVKKTANKIIISIKVCSISVWCVELVWKKMVLLSVRTRQIHTHTHLYWAKK